MSRRHLSKVASHKYFAPALQGKAEHNGRLEHYSDSIMSAMASQITNVSIGCWTVCSGADQRKYQSFGSLAFVMEIYRWPVDSPHKGPVTRKVFLFDDVTTASHVPYIDVFHSVTIFWNTCYGLLSNQMRFPLPKEYVCCGICGIAFLNRCVYISIYGTSFTKHIKSREQSNEN